MKFHAALQRPYGLLVPADTNVIDQADQLYAAEDRRQWWELSDAQRTALQLAGAATVYLAPAAAEWAIAASAAGGALENANFAQTDFSLTFSKGEDVPAIFRGRPIADVAADLRAGRLTPADVPIQYIVRDGNSLILNTRSSQALEQAGIPRSQWVPRNMTGNPEAEARLTGQLERNGLTSQGTPTVRPRGGN